MWILKIPKSDMKDKVSADRVKLRQYAIDQIDGEIYFEIPENFNGEKYVHDPDIIFYVCCEGKKIGTIEYIECL